MNRIHGLGGRAAARAIAVAQIFLLSLAPGCVQPGALDPQPGVHDHRALVRVAVPGAEVDVAGGNLVVRRSDFTIDTRLGTLEVGALYHSATRAWRWSFDARYDGATFVEASGAVHDVSALAPGEAVPGTHWVRLDATRMATKGGLVHSFDAGTHRLLAVSLGSSRGSSQGVGERPELVYAYADVAGEPRVVGVSQCDGANVCLPVHDVDYDANGCIARLEDRAGRVVELVNDAACRPQVVRDPLDVARGWPGRRYGYTAGLLDSLETSEGERTQYVYLDSRVVLVRQHGDGGAQRVTRFDYEGAAAADGLYTTRVRDARGGRSVYRYDADGRLHRHTNAAGETTAFGWAGRRLASQLDPAGALTRWTYLGDDVDTMITPSGNEIRFEYAPGARDPSRPDQRPLARVSDALGTIEARSYDPATGFPVQIENGAGEQTLLGVDTDGSVYLTRTPAGLLAWYDGYGEHGHALRAIYASWTDHRAYDAVGNQTEGADVRDPLSPGRPGVRRLVFDEDRGVAEVELSGRDDLGDAGETVHTLAIERRSDGRVRRITRPYGGEVEYRYDGFGDRVERRERVDGVFRSTVYEYDAGGDLRAVTLANGMRREYARDAAGRVVETRLLQDGVLAQSLAATWAQGRLVRRLDSAHGAPEELHFDAAGRVAQIDFPGGERLELEHDLRSREVRRRYRLAPGAPALRVLERAYDGAGRERELRDGGELVLARTYDAGRPSEIAYGNGLVRRFEYEPDFGLLVGTRLEPASGGEAIEQTWLSWQSCAETSLCVGTRTEFPNPETGPTPVLSYEGYRLGPLPDAPRSEGWPGARLEGWVEDDVPSNIGAFAPLHAFDALGNWQGVREGVDAVVQQHVYNAERNRLLSVSGTDVHSYTWDEAGFLRERDGETFRWSPNGRPTEIGTRFAFTWDVLGRPIASTRDGVTRTWRFGGEISADAVGSLLRLDLDEVAIDLATDTRTYRHLDFRGNVKLVTDDEGHLVLHRSYSPFGVADTHGDHGDDRSFAGGRQLAELLLIGARLYDPAAGQFLSPDPIDDAVNAYAYTQGNPVFFWDPSGEHAEVQGAATNSQMQVAIGRSSATIGIVIVGIGAGTGNLAMVTLGVLMVVVGNIMVETAQPPPYTGWRIEIHDPDADGNFPTADGAASRITATQASGTCSPTAITANPRVAWASLASVGAQVVLAAILIRRRRQRAQR